ncbi:MAG: hypothetical protein PPHEMADM_2951 [uncultured Paraburkholderia sp.]|nr:MAG: hypothetical protein PPHEMADE_2882 [uncultured Paraburkholderia sp.]CAH2927821.1 MAG: hypothetical protein PPHEMADM_2951 [uncultured Paraburkholderia sp.]
MLVTVLTGYFVVSLARVERRIYESDTSTDQCLSMSYETPALIAGASYVLRAGTTE